MDNKQKALNLLGLAQRAGKLVSGESIVLESVRSNKARLVVLAKDASENTTKQFLNKCAYYEVTVNQSFTREEISQAIGRYRTVCSFTDHGFVTSFQKLQQ